MPLKAYLLLCICLTAIIFISILLMPGFADALETWLLQVLARNARVEI